MSLPRVRSTSAFTRMTVAWFIVWLVANLIGGDQPLRLDPVNAWTATLIMVIALDLNRSREIPRKGNPGRDECPVPSAPAGPDRLFTGGRSPAGKASRTFPDATGSAS